MKPTDIARLRLASQHLARTKLTSPKDIVTWMGAMQAQDFPLAMWAIGIRLQGIPENSVASAIDKGKIIRTHLLRPTWHFASASDVYWLLDLSSPQIIASQRAREKELGLTAELISRSNSTIEKALRLHGELSRQDLMLALQKAGIPTDQNRASHLFMRAELEKIICSGAIRRGKPTYALLAEKAPHPRRMQKDEAMVELARRYFASRGPATLQDFTWWSGMSAPDARQALEMVKPELVAEELAGKVYWLTPNLSLPEPNERLVHLLPTYDEYIISYADRSASIPGELERYMKEISNRGVFWPIILVNGQVVGIWKRTITKVGVTVEIKPFSQADTNVLSSIERAAGQFASFLGKNLSLTASPDIDDGQNNRQKMG